jgi:hypothetical protein
MLKTGLFGIALLIGVTASCISQAQVYFWRDGQGVAQYSDVCPAGVVCGVAGGTTSTKPTSPTSDSTTARLNAASPLGTNLAEIADYGREWAFVDAFKASRPWISGSSDNTVWDDGRKLNTDSDGWVQSLESGQIARTLLFWSMGNRYPGGMYTVLYDGEGTLSYGFAATYDPAQSRPGRHVLRVDPVKGGISMYITATTAGNPIRNIRVIMPGGICDGDPFWYAKDASECVGKGYFKSFESNYATIVFHPKFLDSIRTYRVLRFMDWGATNSSAQVAWSDRPKLSNARWTTGKGVPVEIMVDLANRIGSDAWFTLPHLADDSYVTEYARLVSKRLRPDLKAYVEYSNEVWNSQFRQATYARNQGLALGLSTNAFQAQLFYYSQQSVRVFDIWSAVFADPARLIRVMAAQAASTWTSEQVLNFRDAAQKTDAFAIAPYFGGYLGSPSEQNRVQAMNLDALFSELGNVALPQAIGWMNAQAAAAKARGKPLIAYEGGQHLAGHGGVENNTTISALFDSANRDPRMGALYQRYLNAWKASGGTLMTHYLSCRGYNKWGRWGALEYLGQPRAEAPKFDAIQTFIEKNPVWWTQ